MAHTFNKGVDYFALVDQTSPKLKLKSSAENRSKQAASGANCYGDICVVDSYGETCAPSAEYDVIDSMTQATFPNLGTVSTISINGTSQKIVFGSVTINTATGVAPSVSASGQMVQSTATTLRTYTLPSLSITPRHRAQDFINACTIKKGSANASDTEDYGLESVSATFPIEITLAQPQGEVMNYDLHGGTVTANYTMNWYDDTTPPTIALTTAATTAGFTISSPVSKADPEGGYTQYTWAVSLAMIGTEASQQS